MDPNLKFYCNKADSISAPCLSIKFFNHIRLAPFRTLSLPHLTLSHFSINHISKKLRRKGAGYGDVIQLQYQQMRTTNTEWKLCQLKSHFLLHAVIKKSQMFKYFD